MPENTPQTYTPTPWLRENFNNNVWVETAATNEAGEGEVLLIFPTHTASANSSNASLIVASVNSYARHCGPNAIQCAEDDLLGQAKEALKIAVKILDAESDACGIYKANREIIDNVLSRLSRESVASESPRTEQGVES